MLSLVTAGRMVATSENISGTSTFQKYESGVYFKSEVLRAKAGINGYCVGWAKVVFLTITREPIKSSKHLIPVRRCNWLLGSRRHDALCVNYWKRDVDCGVRVQTDGSVRGCRPDQGFHTRANIGEQTRSTFAACICATDDICQPNILKRAKLMWR